MAAPPGMRLFVSYSRADSVIVDRLAANLTARGFHPWVDRDRLEGGMNWRNHIQQAIDSSDSFLLIVTSHAVKSEFVQTEFNHARLVKKLIIPLVYDDVNPDELPLGWGEIQSIDMRADDERGLQQLQAALLHIALPQSQSIPPVQSTLPRPRGWGIFKNRQPKPALQPKEHLTSEELHELFVSGAEAQKLGDLERAVVYWGRILRSDNPEYLDGLVHKRMQELNQDLLARRKRLLRDDAEQARLKGDWRGESAALHALSQMERLDPAIQARMMLADKNGKHQDLYNVVLDLLEKGNRAEAQNALNHLWDIAPDYGDPSMVASGLRVLTPQQREAKRKAEQEATEAKRKAEQEAAARRVKEEYEEQMRVWTARRDEWDATVRSISGFVNGVLLSSPRAVWMAALSLLAGVGCAVSLLTYSWLAGGLTVAILGILAFGIGFRRAIHFPALLLLMLVSSGLALGAERGIELLPMPRHNTFFFLGLGPIGTLSDHALIFTVFYALIWAVVGSVTGGIAVFNANANSGKKSSGRVGRGSSSKNPLLTEDLIADVVMYAFWGLISGLIVAIAILATGWLFTAILLGITFVSAGRMLYENDYARTARTMGSLAFVSLCIPLLILRLDVSTTLVSALGLVVGAAAAIGLASLYWIGIEANKAHPYREPPPALRNVKSQIDRPWKRRQ